MARAWCALEPGPVWASKNKNTFTFYRILAIPLGAVHTAEKKKKFSIASKVFGPYGRARFHCAPRTSLVKAWPSPACWPGLA